MSEPGTGSRRPWLPSAIQLNGHGGGPNSEIDSSSDRRVSESARVETIVQICEGVAWTSCSDTAVVRRPRAASRN